MPLGAHPLSSELADEGSPSPVYLFLRLSSSSCSRREVGSRRISIASQICLWFLTRYFLVSHIWNRTRQEVSPKFYLLELDIIASCFVRMKLQSEFSVGTFDVLEWRIWRAFQYLVTIHHRTFVRIGHCCTGVCSL